MKRDDGAKLRDRLQRRADEVGPPPPLRTGTRRRIRLWQSGFVVGITVVVAATGALATSVIGGLGSGSGERTQVAAAPSGSHRVVVLDADDPGASSRSLAWSAVVEDGRIGRVQRHALGTDADIAPSPDGSVLYTVGIVDLDTPAPRSVLTAIDARSGDTLYEVPVENWQGTTGFHLRDKVVVSPDGGRVYVLVGFPADAVAPPQAVAVFDTASRELLDETVPLQACGGGPVLLPLSPTRLAAVCPDTLEVEIIDVGPDGSAQRTTVPLSLSDVAAAAASPAGDEIYVVAGNGDVAVVDATEGSETATGTIAVPEGDRVALGAAAVTPEGDRLVVAVVDSTNENLGVADGILSAVIGDWSDVIVNPAGAFTWFGVSAADDTVFAVDRSSGELRAVDPRERGAAAVLGRIGEHPLSVHILPAQR